MREVVFGKMEMKNFRVHEDMSFDFYPNRFITISGNNGTGKSTILDALCWALYDETSKGRKGDAVLRKRSPKNTSVILNFGISGDRYVIKNYRKHKKHGDIKLLLKNDNDITGTTRKDTNKQIEELIMPSNIFKNCLLFSQYVGKSFTEMKHAQQSDILDVMLDVGKFHEFRMGATAIVKEKDQDLVHLNNLVPGFHSTVNMSREMLITEEKTRRRIQKEHQEEKVKLIASITKIDEDIKLLQPQLIQIDTHEKTLQSLTAKKAVEQQKLDSITSTFEDEVENLRKLFREKFKAEQSQIEQGVQEQINTFEMETQEFNSNLLQLDHQEKAELSTAETVKMTNRKEVETELDPSIEEKTRSASLMLADINVKDKQIADLLELYFTETTARNDMWKKLEGPEPTCFVCEQVIGGVAKRKVVAKHKTKVKEVLSINEDVESKGIDVEKIKGEHVTLTYDLRILQEEKNLCLEEIDSEFIKGMTDIQTKYSAQKKSVHDKLAEIGSLRNDVDLEVHNKISKKREDLRKEGEKQVTKMRTSLNKNIISLQETIHDIDVKTASETEALAKLKTAKDLHIQNETLKITYGTDLKNLEPKFLVAKEESENKINTFKQKIKDINGDIEVNEISIAKMEKEILILEFWKKGFSAQGIKAILLDEAIPIMNEKAKELSELTECIRVRFDSQTMLKSEVMRNKFNVNVIQTRNLTDDRGDFSGGEGRLVDLITLMSLRYLLERMQDTRFNIFMFDEVLDALDPENVQVVVNMLRGISLTCSVVLISHTLRDHVESDDHYPM